MKNDVTKYSDADLYRAAALNDVDELKRAIEQGKSLDEPNYLGFTPIHIAAMNGSEDFIIHSSILNFDPWKRDANDALSIDYASSRGYQNIYQLLFNAMYPRPKPSLVHSVEFKP